MSPSLRIPSRSPLLAGALLVAAGAAQDLRRGVLDAEVVVIGRHVGVQPLGNDLLLHRIRVVESISGSAPESITLVEAKRVADVPQPRPGEDRIYCLRVDRREDLPERHGPYYRMLGHRGDNPVVATDDPRIELVRILVDSQTGASPQAIADRVLPLALRGDARVRTEAVELLRERPALRDAIRPIARSELLSRAVGETEDIPFKIAIASLCAELRSEGVVEALCLSIDAVEDPRFARALGRIARHLHGERATEILQPAITRSRRPAERDRLLLALGATGTEQALEALLRMRRVAPSAGVDAALHEHGSPRALAALDKDRSGDK